MREIKFRAWLDDVCRMYEFDEEESLGEHFNRINFGHKSYKLMQYTGLKDKNGREIYEGDIVKIYWRKDEDVGVVAWYINGFYVRGLKCHSPQSVSSLSITVEVIGNIYENPELLEGK